MVQIIEQGGDLFGRIGKGIGQGLSEQIPKEVERYSLASGLKRLGENAGNMTPLQIATEAYGIRGLTPAMASTLPGILREENSRQASIRRGKRGSSSRKESISEDFPQRDKEISPEIYRDDQNANFPLETRERGAVSGKGISPAEEEGITTALPQVLGLSTLRPWTFEKKQEQVARYLEEDPSLTEEQANSLANEEEKRELESRDALIERGKREEAVEGSMRDLLDTELAKRSSRPDAKSAYDLVSGDSQKLLADQADVKYRKALNSNHPRTKRSIINEQVELAKDLQRSRNSVREQKGKGTFQTSYPAQISTLKNSLKAFQEIGNEEEFRDLLTSELEYPEQYASYISFPLSNNKNLNNYIAKLPKTDVRTRIKGKAISDILPVAMDEIINNLGPKDSLQTLALSLAQKGIPYEWTIRAMKDNEQLGKKINNRQRRELDYDANRSSIKGLMMQVFGGLPPIQEVE
jgi:hypothetical protein